MPADLLIKECDPSWLWWKHGVIYHIYPRSFFDTNGDGIGDLQGIICKLSYLADLGIDAIWLSPVFTSPNFDFGYDVSDYRGINPEYGTIDDFMELLEKCHVLGIRVIMDMVLNHTSINHPWFIESRASRKNPYRKWYIWKNGKNGKPPNNWKAAIGGNAWKYDPQSDQYYMHSFFKEQPDLNWRNNDMQEAVFAELTYWLDLGVDGFRLDVINLIAKDKKFRNNPFFMGLPFLQKHKYSRNRPRSVKIVARLRELLDKYHQRVAIGEVYAPPPGNPETVARYLADGKNGIHLAFDFSLIFSKWNAHHYYQRISNWYSKIPEQGWPCNVMSNHDLFRSINRQPWQRLQEEKAKITAFLLLTLKGTPFIYYGEEIGMKNGKIKKSRIQDPLGKKYWPIFKGRDKARTPMQWSPEPSAGFTEGIPWLPVNNDFSAINVEKQDGIPGSILALYQSLIRIRKEHASLCEGDWVPLLNGKTGVLAYLRTTEKESLLVVLNFTGSSKKTRFPEKLSGEILLSTSRKTGERFFTLEMILLPFEATLYVLL